MNERDDQIELSPPSGPMKLAVMERVRKRPSLVAASILVCSVGWVLFSNWDPISNGHPSYLFLYGALLALGAWLIVAGLRADLDRRRLGWSISASIGILLLTAIGLWLSPFGPDDVAIGAMAGSASVSVSESATEIVLQPAADTGSGVIFYPGARVDARAYVNVLTPIAAAGNRIVIVKEPLGIGFLAAGFVDSWIADHASVDTWIVGGHSLGGVVASSNADANAVDGLLLWASFPASDISDLNIDVASIYGSEDGFSEADRVEASAEDLPPSAQFHLIEGGIHSFFGDYGIQPGDGEPTTSRLEAQTEIIAVSTDFANSVSIAD